MRLNAFLRNAYTVPETTFAVPLLMPDGDSLVRRETLQDVGEHSVIASKPSIFSQWIQRMKIEDQEEINNPAKSVVSKAVTEEDDSIKQYAENLNNEMIKRYINNAGAYTRGEKILDTLMQLRFTDSVRNSIKLAAHAKGTATAPYIINMTLRKSSSVDETQIDQGHCSCPVGRNGRCKHCVALLLQLMQDPTAFVPDTSEASSSVSQSYMLSSPSTAATKTTPQEASLSEEATASPSSRSARRALPWASQGEAEEKKPKKSRKTEKSPKTINAEQSEPEEKRPKRARKTGRSQKATDTERCDRSDDDEDIPVAKKRPKRSKVTEDLPTISSKESITEKEAKPATNTVEDEPSSVILAPDSDAETDDGLGDSFTEYIIPTPTRESPEEPKKQDNKNAGPTAVHDTTNIERLDNNFSSDSDDESPSASNEKLKGLSTADLFDELDL
ncbi:uncharacterized protein BYT42DRAFT_229294 [Radiomyces spectabilis]|uniref:uncharacterized protein n=1 Tax=Radiomyces spectabilis TaxID=64574 RepID=UPI0022200AAA|nr:uncharacterized protein BYT42DRAFT_229294 [Radiomyces spectabilis]KAI8388284.1 hypothetical protein BYT42DRAFT_229294 [Radiomyces spectabilis]